MPTEERNTIVYHAEKGQKRVTPSQAQRMYWYGWRDTDAKIYRGIFGRYYQIKHTVGQFVREAFGSVGAMIVLGIFWIAVLVAVAFLVYWLGFEQTNLTA